MPMPKFINEYLVYDSEVYVDGDIEIPVGDTLLEWIGAVARDNIRIGIKYSPDRSAYIATATGYTDTETYPDGWVISAFGGDVLSALGKIWLVCEYYGGRADIDKAWLAIGDAEQQIKQWLKGEVKKAKQSRKTPR